ncbi:MAG TPA: hypothetical protein VD790_12310 [Thermoleophilaceae bacterium]|nr:hypothetical protein [Thermoleophilaceae bacterium]
MTNLSRVIEAAGPDLAAHASADPGPDRFESAADDSRAYVLEAVYEAYLLHYGEPRGFTGMDPDLRLLAGDALYAQGLARLAELRDLEAVAELADLISLCAWAEAAGRRDLVEALWVASARRLLGGSGPGARAEVSGELAQGRA